MIKIRLVSGGGGLSTVTLEVKTIFYVVKGAKESLLVLRVGHIKMQSKESRWGGLICSPRTIG